MRSEAPALLPICRSRVQAEILAPYQALTFADLNEALNALMTKEPDWESPAESMYSTRRQLLQVKTNDVEAAIGDMIKAFEHLDETMDSYWLGVAFFLAGVVLAWVGLCITLATFETGVGAIVGLIVAVVGLLFTLFSGVTLPNLGAETELVAEKFRQLNQQISATTWGSPTKDSEWTW